MKRGRLTPIGLAVMMLTLAGCDGAAGPAVDATPPPMRSADDRLEAPNSMPSGLMITPIAPVTDVVGVTHLPP